MQQEHMTTLIDRLNNPELHYPGNFDTPARANAVLMSLCQEAADVLAAPAVPDAFGTREGEHPQYIQGWNDCRAEMLKEKS